MKINGKALMADIEDSLASNRRYSCCTTKTLLGTIDGQQVQLVVTSDHDENTWIEDEPLEPILTA